MFLELCLALVLLGTGNALLLEDVSFKNCSRQQACSQGEGEGGHQREVDNCPPWFVQDTSEECRHGPKLGGLVKQDLDTLQTSLMMCTCMSMNGNGSLIIGGCIFTCMVLMGYYPLPCEVSHLENYTCAGLHRHGLFCSKCNEGYAYPVYSADLACVECKDYKYNWLKYLAATILPLTLFYIIVTFFSISFTSPMLSGFVIVCQMMGHPIQLKLVQSSVHSGTIIGPNVMKAVLSIAALWNLDFFRLYYSFCLHPDVSEMMIMSLDYATTVYPVLLIAITYCLVKLHDHNIKIVVWTWKLISVFRDPIKRRWNIRTSLVDVFASFIYLSSTRLLVTAMSFVIPLITYTLDQQPNGSAKLSTRCSLYFFPTVKYFSTQHLPFALVSITLLIVFFILPMLLLFLYPFNWFQKCLNRISISRITLYTFVDVIQGYYKNGTDGSKDRRYMSGFLLFIPLVLNFIFLLTKSSMFYPLGSVCVLIYLMLLLIFLPYKRKLHNYVAIGMTSVLLALFSGIAINCSSIAQGMTGKIEFQTPLVVESGFWTSIILMSLSIAVLLLYIIISLFIIILSSYKIRM